MKLTPGEIYFIRELDVHSGIETPFIKIGLVREKKEDDRWSEDRAGEHQTGNPRKLFVDSVIKTTAVAEIENILHYLHADDRVHGEWFEFSEEKFAQVKQIARDLVETAANNAENFRKAEALGKHASSNEILRPNQTMREWHQKFIKSDIRLNHCKSLQDAIKKIFVAELFVPEDPKEQIERQEELSPFVKVQEKKMKSKFDVKAFAISRPDLYEEFSQIEISKPKGSFLIQKLTNQDFPLSIIDPKLSEYSEQALSTIEDFKLGKKTESDLHTVTLKLRGFEAKASWDKEIAKVNLQVFCGTNTGIEGICKWNRKPQEKRIFDENAFLEAHPRIAANFMVSAKSGTSVVVEKKRAYPHYKKKK